MKPNLLSSASSAVKAYQRTIGDVSIKTIKSMLYVATCDREVLQLGYNSNKAILGHTSRDVHSHPPFPGQ